MGKIKTTEEIEILREGGRRLSRVLYEVAGLARPGVTARELDRAAEEKIVALGDKPAFKNYRPAGARIAFPATLCVSINDEIVHGIPTDRVLEEGDIVGLDLGINHGGLFTDMAVTVAVGTIAPTDRELIEKTKEGLAAGIAAIRPGASVGDIGAAIEAVARSKNYGVVRELGGHGVGHAIHETPHIPNYGAPASGEKIKAGMVLAIEPMFNLGRADIVLGEDDFTYKTADGSRSAHFEKTVLVTEVGVEILTP